MTRLMATVVKLAKVWKNKWFKSSTELRLIGVFVWPCSVNVWLRCHDVEETREKW